MPLIPTPLQASTIPEITVDGRANAELARDVCLLQVDEDVHGLRRLLATFVAVGPRAGEQNEQLNWLDGAVLDFGKELRVAMGPSDARTEMFVGKLSALELGPEPRIHAVQCEARLGPRERAGD